MEDKKMNEKILNVFKAMEDEEIRVIWNEYCYATNSYDDEILDAYAFEEWAGNEDTMNVLNRMYFGHDEEGTNSSANPNRNYFCFNGYANVISFDYIYNEYSEKFYNMDIDALIDYIVENNESFNNDDIEEILAGEEA